MKNGTKIEEHNYPVVSVITPLYNGEEYIGDTIESVRNQTFRDWEMVIVDDQSRDSSLEIAHSYAQKDSRIRIKQLPKRSGPAVARNHAINLSKGRLIAFLDSDDLWVPEKLEKQVSYMLENNLHFTFSWYQEMDEQGSLSEKIVQPPEKVCYEDMLKTCHIGCLTAMYDTDHFGKVRMPNMKRRQDYALWLELLKRDDCAHGIQEVLAFYRRRTVSVSSNKLKLLKYNWNVLRKNQGMSVGKSAYYLSHVILNKLFRR